MGNWNPKLKYEKSPQDGNQSQVHWMVQAFSTEQDNFQYRDRDRCRWNIFLQWSKVGTDVADQDECIISNELARRNNRDKKLVLKDKKLNDKMFSTLLRTHNNPGNVLEIELNDNESIFNVPQTIGYFKNLETLVLKNNYIQDVSWSVMYLRNLKSLDLSQNALGTFPKSVVYINKLCKLDLSYNPFQVLPSELLLLNDLKQFKVDHCTNLQSPSLELCQKEGVEGIFRYLKQRKFRKNVWEGGTPWYSELPVLEQHYSLKTLAECCIDTIFKFDVAFFESCHVPPVLKTDIQKLRLQKMSEFTISKCETCQGYFTTLENFESHAC